MQAHGNFANCQSLPYVAVYHHALSRHSDSDLAQIFVLTSVSCTGQSDDYGLDEYRRDMADMRALINNPPVISTKTLQEMGSQANKRPKVEVPLPQIVDASWESPIGHKSLTPMINFQKLIRVKKESWDASLLNYCKQPQSTLCLS